MKNILISKISPMHLFDPFLNQASGIGSKSDFNGCHRHNYMLYILHRVNSSYN